MTLSLGWLRRAPLALPLFPFGVGIALADLFLCPDLAAEPDASAAPSADLLTALAALAAWGLGCLFVLSRRRPLRSLWLARRRSAGFLIIFLLTCLLLGALRRAVATSPCAPPGVGRFTQWRAVALDSRHTAKGEQVNLLLVARLDGDRLARCRHKVQAWIPAHDTVPPGTVLRVAGWLNPLAGNGVGSDSVQSVGYARYLRRHGFAARLSVRRIEGDTSATACRELDRLSLLRRIQIRSLQCQTALSARYDALPCTSQGRAVLAALTLGDKSQLTRDTRQVYSQAGAAHILALSGLHLGLLLGVVSLLFRRVRRSRRGRMAYAATALALIWGLTLLTGTPVSLVRAAVMGSVWAVLDAFGRENSGFNNLMLTALILLALDPQTLFNVGFQLSFIAVASILILPKNLFSKRSRPLRVIGKFVAVCCVAQLATAPIVAWQFGGVPVYFLLGNALAVPAAWLLLAAALLFFGLGWIPALGPALSGAVGWLMAHTANLLTDALAWVASL